MAESLEQYMHRHYGFVVGEDQDEQRLVLEYLKHHSNEGHKLVLPPEPNRVFDYFTRLLETGMSLNDWPYRVRKSYNAIERRRLENTEGTKMSATGKFIVKGNGRIRAPGTNVGNVKCGDSFVLLENMSQHHSGTDIMMKVHVPDCYRRHYETNSERRSYVVNVTQGKLGVFGDSTRIRPVDVEAEVFV